MAKVEKKNTGGPAELIEHPTVFGQMNVIRTHVFPDYGTDLQRSVRTCYWTLRVFDRTGPDYGTRLVLDWPLGVLDEVLVVAHVVMTLGIVVGAVMTIPGMVVGAVVGMAVGAKAGVALGVILGLVAREQDTVRTMVTSTMLLGAA